MTIIYESGVNNTSDMPIIKLDDGTRLYWCEFRAAGGYKHLKQQHSDYKPLILKLWKEYCHPASDKQKQKAEQQLRYYNDYLQALVGGTFRGQLENIPQTTKQKIWRDRHSTQRDLLHNFDKRRSSLPEGYNEAAGSTGEFINYMKATTPKELKDVDVGTVAEKLDELEAESMKAEKIKKLRKT